MRATLHLPFPGKAQVRMVGPAARHEIWRLDRELANADPLLDVSTNEGGPVRPRPL